MHLGIAISRHGENKKKSKYNAWLSLVATIIFFVLYYYAGLFNNFIQ